MLAGEVLAGQYDLETFIDQVAGPLREQYAKGDEYVHEVAAPFEYLSPQHVEALKALQAVGDPKAHRLSNAFQVYLKTHQRGNQKAFIEKQQRDWNTLIATVGDIQFKDLSRDHARLVVDVLRQQGKKTATVRRTITALSAVTASAIREWAEVRTNPFEKLGIQANQGPACAVLNCFACCRTATLAIFC